MEPINKEELTRIYDEEFIDLQKKLIQLLINFGRNTLELSPVDHPKYIIRNSILYRLKSIRFHLFLAVDAYQGIIRKFDENFFSQKTDDHHILTAGSEQMLFIFDDIVFNSASLLDYIGNLIGLLYINKPSIKWNGICNSVSDKDNKLSKTQIAPIILKHHHEWINHLYGYRSSLIHIRKDEAESNHTKKYERNENGEGFEIHFGFNVKAPHFFEKNIKIISQEIPMKDPSIIDVSYWLAEKTVKTTNELISCAKAELEPIINEKLEMLYEKFKKR